MNREELLKEFDELMLLILHHKNSITRDDNGLYFPFGLVEYMLDDIKEKAQEIEKEVHKFNYGETNHLGETSTIGTIDIPDELKGKKLSWSFSEKPGIAIVNMGGRNYQVDENNDVQEVKTSMKKFLQ